MSKKLPKKGASLTQRIRAILEDHGCPDDQIEELAVELREMVCQWRDERGSNGRRQGTPGGLRRRMPDYLL